MPLTITNRLRDRRIADLAAARAAGEHNGELHTYQAVTMGGPRPAEGFSIPTSTNRVYARSRARAVELAIEAHRIEHRLDPTVSVLVARMDDHGPTYPNGRPTP